MAVLAGVIPGAVARGDSQVDFKPGLVLGGGYDDNLLFNGQGGDALGEVGGLVDLKAWERRYNLELHLGLYAYGFLQHEQIAPLGESTLNFTGDITRLDTFRARVKVRGSDDPLGLAQLGLLNVHGNVLGYRTGSEFEHLFDERTSLAALFNVDGIGFLTPTYTSESGEAFTVGMEPRYRFTRDITGEVSVQERNFFGLTLEGISVAALPGVRYTIMRHLYAEGDIGPALFHNTEENTPLPIGHALLEYDDHTWGARLTASQDLAVPTGRSGVLLMDLVETTVRYGDNNWEFRVRGGYYRSLASPTASLWEPGYGAQVEAYRKLGDFTWIGFRAVRFQNIATPYQQPTAEDAIYAQITLTKARP